MLFFVFMHHIMSNLCFVQHSLILLNHNTISSVFSSYCSDSLIFLHRAFCICPFFVIFLLLSQGRLLPFLAWNIVMVSMSLSLLSSKTPLGPTDPFGSLSSGLFEPLQPHLSGLRPFGPLPIPQTYRAFTHNLSLTQAASIICKASSNLPH